MYSHNRYFKYECLLVKLKKGLNLSYIFIGNNLVVVRLVINRRIVMNKGRIVEVLSSDSFAENAQNQYTKSLLNVVLTTDGCK